MATGDVTQGAIRAPSRTVVSAERQGLWRRVVQRTSPLGLAGTVMVCVFVFGAIFAPLITSSDPTKQDLRIVMLEPSLEYPLGTDEFGRDALARLLYGGRMTLTIAVLASVFGLIVGSFLGLTAGYYGDPWDAVAMRAIDVLLAFPGILLALTLVSVLGFGISNIIAAIAIVSVPSFARLARGSTLSTKQIEYITAARTVGASNARVLGRHLLPNILAPLVTLWALRLGTSILTASGLGFLGLGVQPPTPEWGVMLSNARSYMQTAPRLLAIPGLAITFVVLGFALMGDWLRDLLDPKTS